MDVHRILGQRAYGWAVVFLTSAYLNAGAQVVSKSQGKSEAPNRTTEADPVAAARRQEALLYVQGKSPLPVAPAPVTMATLPSSLVPVVVMGPPNFWVAIPVRGAVYYIAGLSTDQPHKLAPLPVSHPANLTY